MGAHKKDVTEKQKLADDLMSQLHEQFAINDNDKSNKIINFIEATSFVLIGYGFALWNIFKEKVTSDPNSNIIDLLLYITLAANIVLTLLAFLCLNFGYCIRRDQFIIQRIRKGAMGDSQYNRIFGNLYSPRKKCFTSFIIGSYSIFFVFLNIIIICIYLVTLQVYCEQCASCNCYIVLIFMFINIVANIVYYIYLFTKYLSLNKNH